MVGTSRSAWKCPICLCLFVDLFVLGPSSAHTFKQQTKLGNWQESLQDRTGLGETRRKKGQRDKDLTFPQTQQWELGKHPGRRGEIMI